MIGVNPFILDQRHCGHWEAALCQVCYGLDYNQDGHSLMLLPSGKQFDVDDAILNSLKGLEVTLAIDSSVKIDDCECIHCCT